MCGIVGIVPVQSTKRSLVKSYIEVMSEKVANRGPNDCGYYIDDDWAVGHRRLSIQDLNETGHQPMVSANSDFVIVFNGEIYNAPDIKKLPELKHIAWRGHSDTEVLLEYIGLVGVVKACKELNGMFAFAVLDKRKQKVTLARDRFGKKPLYYGINSNGLYFSSELSSFCSKAGWLREISSEGLSTYLEKGHTGNQQSILQGVRKVCKAQIVEIDLNKHVGEIECRNYYEFPSRKIIETNRESIIANLNSLVIDSTLKRLASDVPLGAFLSGGIDSSLIVAIMQKYSNEPINTFTIGFKDSKFNEADKAEQIANYLGTKQRTFYVQENEILGLVKDLPICYDEPFADASALPSMLVSKYAKDYVSVVLTGDGGDENFYGYNHYEITSKIYKYSSWIPKKLRKILSELISSSAASQNRKLLLAKYLNYNDFSHLYNVVHSLYPELIHSNAKKNITYNKNNQYEFMQDWDFDNYLVDDILTKMDRASMYYSLEARSPLLDYRIMEFSRNISLDNHLDGNRKKSLLKDLLFKYIPANYYSENKQGFSVPLAYWLSTVLRKWALERLNEAKRDELIKSLIDINSVLDRFIKYPSVNDVQIWAICCYMDWKNRNDV